MSITLNRVKTLTKQPFVKQDNHSFFYSAATVLLTTGRRI